MSRTLLSWLLGLVGAVIGGVAGYFVFGWILRYGLYAPLIPGAFLGAGCGLLARQHSFLRGLLCGLAGLALGVYTEWKYMPFVKDGSFTFFIQHMTPVTMLLQALGGFLAYWFGRERLWGREEAPPA